MWSHLFLVLCPSCQAKFHCELPHTIFNCHLKRDSNSKLWSELVQRAGLTASALRSPDFLANQRGSWWLFWWQGARTALVLPDHLGGGWTPRWVCTAQRHSGPPGSWPRQIGWEDAPYWSHGVTWCWARGCCVTPRPHRKPEMSTVLQGTLGRWGGLWLPARERTLIAVTQEKHYFHILTCLVDSFGFIFLFYLFCCSCQFYRHDEI